jgi:hypothetical protein
MQLTKQDKTIAGILIGHGAQGLVWTFWIASQLGFPLPFLGQNFALAAAGVIAGIGSLQKQRWAAILGELFFAIQVIHILTPTIRFSFTLGLNINISLGWIDSGELGLNLYALAMLLWSGYRFSASDSAFKPKMIAVQPGP